MKRRILALTASCIMVVAMLAGCGGAKEEAAPAEAPAESEAAVEESAAESVEESVEEAVAEAGEGKDLADCKIGLAVHFKTDDYGVICSEAFENTCKEAGVGTYTVQDANSDAATQLNQIETFIADGYDAICISPVDDQACADVINKAHDAGIKVVTITYVPDAEVDVNIAAGNYDFSKEVAEMLAKKMDYEGQVAILDIATNLWRTNQRYQAFLDVIDEYEGLELVDTQKTMDPDEAISLAQNILTAYPDVKGIWCTYSNVTYGAGQAVADLGRSDLVVGGVDADNSILNLMKDGYIYAVAAQIPDTHGQMAAQAAVDMLSGKDVEPEYTAKYKCYNADEDDPEDICQEVWGKPLS